jgi:hypothetical protein
MLPLASMALVFQLSHFAAQAQVDAEPVRVLSSNGIEVSVRRTEPGLGMQGVGWGIRNLTGDTLRVHLSKTFYSNTGRLVKSIDGSGFYSGVVVYPNQTIRGARLLGDDVVLWNDFFYGNDLQKGELIGRITVSAKVVNLSQQNREKAQQQQLAARRAKEEAEKQRAIEEAQRRLREQKQREEQELHRQRQHEAQVRDQQQRMLNQLNESARQRGAAIENLVSSLNSIASGLMAQSARKTIARMKEQREEAFQYLMEDVRERHGTIVDCRYCDGRGLERCDECYGEGSEKCGSCDDGRQRCMICAGTGRVLNLTCTSCGGRGSGSCTQCFGQGERLCVYCGGLGQKNCGDCSGTGKEFVETDREVPPYVPERAPASPPVNRYVSHNPAPATASSADIPEVSAAVEGLYFYADDKRDSLRTSFRFVTTSRVQYMVNLKHPRIGRRVEYELELLCTDPHGRVKTAKRSSYVEPDWVNSYFWGNVPTVRPGSDMRGNLIPGRYRMQVRYKGKVIADNSFDVLLLKEDLKHPLVRGPWMKEQRFYAEANGRIYRDTFATGMPMAIFCETLWLDPAPERKTAYPVYIARVSPEKFLFSDYLTFRSEKSYRNDPLPNGATRSSAHILAPVQGRIPGRYSVEFSLGSKGLSTAHFYMTSEFDIPDIDGYATGIRFFMPDGENRDYGTRFSHDSLSHLYYELNLKYEPVEISHRSIFVDVSCTTPEGNERNLGQTSIVIEPGWSSSWHTRKFDLRLDGPVPKGIYWLECRYEGRSLGKNWFELY